MLVSRSAFHWVSKRQTELKVLNQNSGLKTEAIGLNKYTAELD